MPGIADTTDRSIVTVERAIAVLEALADSPSDLGTNEIARRTGTNASSISRLLNTLAKEEMVHRVPDNGRWRLGLRLVQMGHSALSRVDLRDLARPHLVTLTETTGETATLSVPGEHTAMTVDFVQSPSSVRSVAQLGRPSVPHATSIGKVFLAYSGQLPDGPLQAYTTRTITDPDELGREVAQVRERGWAEAIQEREDDLNAIAAPVIDSRGDLVSVLGLQGPAGRFNRRAMRAAADSLLQQAAQLAAQPVR